MKKIIFTFVMVMLFVASSFSQTATDKKNIKAIEDNTFIVKTNFPKVYKVIVNEANAAFYDDYKLQKDVINAQCIAFSIYVILVFTDPPTIPRDVLTDIQVQSVRKNCKNYTMDRSCDKLTDQFQKLDCSLSYMIINWIGTITEMNDQIAAYRAINKAL